MVRSSRLGIRLGGQARVGCRSSLRRGRGGMGCAVHLAGGVNQSGSTTPQRVMTCTTRTDQGKAGGGVHATLGRCSRGRT